MTKEIWNKLAMKQALVKITYEIIERNKGVEGLVLAGTKAREVYSARRMRDRLREAEKVDVPVGELDITLYRNDRKENSSQERIPDLELMDLDVTNKNIVLADDVLYTGRTTRVAMDTLTADGQPKSISVTVLVDRGHRELPIKADFVGKNIPTSLSEQVSANVNEIDGVDSIELINSKQRF